MQDLKKYSLPFLLRDMLHFEYGTKIEIQLKTICQNPLEVYLRGISQEGQFTYKHITTAGAVEKIETFRLSDIPILLTLEDSDNNFGNGELYAVASLLLNGTKVHQFFAGYVHGKFSLTWPYISAEEASFGKYGTGTVVSPDPAAGAEITYTVSDGSQIRVMALRFVLVTSAGVANRRVHIVVTRGGVKIFDIIANTDQTASLTKTYSCVAGAGNSASSDDNDIFIPLPPNIILSGGDKITTETTNLQAGDNFGAMTVDKQGLLLESGA